MDLNRRRPKSSAAALAGAALGAGMLAAAGMAAAAGGRSADPAPGNPAFGDAARVAAADAAAPVEPQPPMRERWMRERGVREISVSALEPAEFQRPSARAAPAPQRDPAGPGLAVIIDDVGFDGAALQRLLALDVPLTFSVLPYAPDAPGAARRIAASGGEVFLHLPMEPAGLEDPGPFAITTAMDATAAAERAAWALSRVPGAVGVNNHMGSRLTADADAAARALAGLARSDLVFIDSVTTPRSVASQAAARLGLASARRDVFLDHERDPAAISAQIDRALEAARAQGTAIAIAHPYPETIEALAALKARAAAAGVALVSARQAVARVNAARSAAPGLTARAGAANPTLD